MVLQQTHPARHGAQVARLDPNRIFGISSTLALNILALAMLLSPVTLPSPASRSDRAPDLQVVPIVPIERRLPPDPPRVVPVTPPRVQPQSVQRIAPAVPTAADMPTPADHGIVVDTARDIVQPQGDAVATGPATPLAGMQLQYARAPSPAYPRVAIQRRLEGVVLLRVLVGTDGRPLEVSIEQSSGHALLDREALRHVQRHWTFRPALHDGQAVEAVGIVPIDFRLDRG